MLRKLQLRALHVKKIFNKGELTKFNESFLGGTNATYIENLYNNWIDDPKSVHASWDAYFRNEARDMDGEQSFITPN